ncbi:MAG: hydroxymethylbilane synthase [Planctomycetota bacterium]|nr:hydroxymethylbilane synthase [Planctomycetota bacterium]
MSPSTIRIATRSSQLALWQAHHIADCLRVAGHNVDIIHVSTSGDRDQQGALRSFGGMGVFTREVQRVVLDGDADVAVHSLKDLPGESADGLCLAAVPERASRFDALVMPSSWSGHAAMVAGDPLAILPPGARVGTGSPRRQTQLAVARPDLQLAEIRGNVDTRLRKLDDGEYDALVLAEAGLSRLEHADRITCRLAPPLMYGAVGQGALGLECRTDDESTRRALGELTDSPSMACITAERALMIDLQAGCHAPLGVQTLVLGDTLVLEAVLLSLDGSRRLLASSSDLVGNATALGREVARNLLDQGAESLTMTSD